MPKVSQMLRAKTKSANKHWIESALDIVLLEENKREYKKRTYFRPSSAHWCSRCLWYQMKGYPEEAIEREMERSPFRLPNDIRESEREQRDNSQS